MWLVSKSEVDYKLKQLTELYHSIEDNIYFMYYEKPESDWDTNATHRNENKKIREAFMTFYNLLTARVKRVMSVPVMKQMEHSSTSLSVFTFNMLADSLAQFPSVDPQYLHWTYRKPLIVNILKRSCADVICLQECDKFEELLENLPDYIGFFKKKSDKHLDGVAIFIKKSVPFHSKAELEFKNGAQVALAVKLLKDGNVYVVVTTHLKASDYEKKLEKNYDSKVFERRRLEQVKQLETFINERFLNSNLVLCGDFNAEKNESCLEYLTNNMKLTNVYKTHFAGDLYTTYKKRTTLEKKQAIDHMYVSNNLKVECLLDIPQAVEFLPNKSHPSDHVPIMVQVVGP